MLHYKIISIETLFVLLILVCSVDLKAQHKLSPDVRQTIEASRANDAFWSVVVRDTTGEMLEGFNDKKLMHPASNLKLLTSAAILNELGANYTFTTKIYGVGHQSGNTWEGDIIIRGAGDPSISGKFYNEDRFHVYNKFFSALDSMGVRKINGNLIGNDSFFDQEPYPEEWNWQDLSFYYGVEINALSFNNNAVDLRVYAKGDIGEKPEIEWFPFDTDYVNFVNEQVITPPDSEYDEDYRRVLGTNTIMLRSKVPKNYVETESLSVFNAPRFFLDTFKKYLEDGGITLGGRIIVDSQNINWNAEQYKELFRHESVPLKKMLSRITQNNDNFYTEMLLKTMAAEHFDAAGSTELGLSLLEDFATTLKMDTTKLEVSDGSGMASSTLVKSGDLSRMLVEMRKHPLFDIYKKNLSVGGVSGPLKNRFSDSKLRGKIYGKTGYVSGVRSLSGYMEATSGQTLAFSVITNNYTHKTSYIDQLHGEIIQNLYEKY